VLERRPARGRTFTIPKSLEGEPRKAPRRLNQTARTKTDTGRRDEDSQALERTLVKELGKLRMPNLGSGAWPCMLKGRATRSS
jgi:hypothetical protein